MVNARDAIRQPSADRRRRLWPSVCRRVLLRRRRLLLECALSRWLPMPRSRRRVSCDHHPASRTHGRRFTAFQVAIEDNLATSRLSDDRRHQAVRRMGARARCRRRARTRCVKHGDGRDRERRASMRPRSVSRARPTAIGYVRRSPVCRPDPRRIEPWQRRRGGRGLVPRKPGDGYRRLGEGSRCPMRLRWDEAVDRTMEYGWSDVAIDNV